MFHLHSGLAVRPPSTIRQPVTAVHADTAAGHPTRRYYQHNVLQCVLPVRRAVGNTVNTRGDRTVVPTIAYNGESTRQGSIPFARGGDTLVAAAVLTTCTTVLWCGVGKYYIGQKPS